MTLATNSRVSHARFERLEPRVLLSSTGMLEQVVSGTDVMLASSSEIVAAAHNVNKPSKPSRPDSSAKGDDIGDTFDSATAVPLDSQGSGSLTGKIDTSADVDVLSLVATQTGVMQVDLVAIVNKKNDVSGDLSAYDSARLLIGSDGDPADVDATVTFDVVSGGTYYVRIASLSGTGKYNVAMATTVAPEPEPDPPPPDPDPPPPEPDPDPPPPDPEPDPPGEYVPGSEVAWMTETLADGLGLVVLGTDSAEQITVSRSGGATVIITPAGTYTLTDTFASVQLYGFGGNDLLVSISGVSEMVWGGAGLDSFWADSLDVIGDAEAAEIAALSVHQVTEFYQPTSDPGQYVSLELAGQDIVDPTAGTPYVDFSHKPVFVDGPQYDDIIQGGVGDCYFMAALSSLADSDPGIIEQMIAPMGDGTYAVRFYRGGDQVYLRIDGELPNVYSDNLRYARLTPDGELWVALAEKAYAQFRYGENSYASLAGGWMGTVYTEITNAPADSVSTASMSTNALAQYMLDGLEAGHALSAGSYYGIGGAIVGGHAYVIKAIENVAGQWYVTVYNVWGKDGGTITDGNYNDGLVTLSINQFAQDFSALSAATV